MDNIEKITLYLDSIEDNSSSTRYSIRKSDRTWGEFPEKDFIIPLTLIKKEESIGYVDISTDQAISTIVRQEFNPFFIEYDFFSTITRNRILDSTNLTAEHISFIREMRPDIDSIYTKDEDIRIWFDISGYITLPWNPGTSNEVTLNTLDILTINTESIVSKAPIYPIDINN